MLHEVEHIGKIDPFGLHLLIHIDGVRLCVLQNSSLFVIVCLMRGGVGSCQPTQHPI